MSGSERNARRFGNLEEGADSLDDDVGRFADLLLVNYQRRCEANDVTVRILAKNTIVSQLEANLPRVDFCNFIFLYAQVIGQNCCLEKNCELMN